MTTKQDSARLRERVISESLEFLLENDGFPDGRFHPIRKKISIGNIEEVLRRAREINPDYEQLKPYHAKVVQGVWSDGDYVKEVVVKKIDTIRKSLGRNLESLIKEISYDKLKTPFQERVLGMDYQISMGKIVNMASVYEYLMQYLTYIGELDSFSELRPYHLQKASQNSFDNEETLDELVKKRLDFIRERDFDGDYGKLISGIKVESVLGPYSEVVGGIEFPVSSKSLFVKRGYSLHNLVRNYLVLSGKPEVASKLKPYHMSKESNHSINAENMANLLQIWGHYWLSRKGSISEIQATNKSEFSNPITETIAGYDLEISVYSLYEFYGGFQNTLRAFIDSCPDNN